MAENQLNIADSQLGDGDTGQTMRRVAEAVSDAAEAFNANASADLGTFFRQLGMGGMSATGSSLGTLVSIGLMEIGKTFRGREEVEVEELHQALKAAETAMLSRGGASLGDKTALDVLHAIHTQLQLAPSDSVAACQAAQHALDAFREKPCQIGRARMFAERSVGLDDPGMLAFVKLTEAIADDPAS